MMNKIAIAILMTISSTAAFASTPSDSSVNKLVELTPYAEVFKSVAFGGYERELQGLAYSVSNDDKLTDKQREDAIQAYKSYAENLIKTIDTPAKQAEIKKAYANAVKKVYSQDEVNALIAFYDNKVLQTALAKDDEVLTNYLQSLEKSTTDAMDKYNKTHRTKMEDAIKRITNQ